MLADDGRQMAVRGKVVNRQICLDEAKGAKYVSPGQRPRNKTRKYNSI